MVFLELSCFFNDPVDVSNLICGSSAFSKSSLNICKFTMHVLFKLGLENFENFESLPIFGYKLSKQISGKWPKERRELYDKIK